MPMRKHVESLLYKHPLLLEQTIDLIQRCDGALITGDAAVTPLAAASSSPAVIATFLSYLRCYPDSMRCVAASAVNLAAVTRLESSVGKVTTPWL